MTDCAVKFFPSIVVYFRFGERRLPSQIENTKRCHMLYGGYSTPIKLGSVVFTQN